MEINLNTKINSVSRTNSIASQGREIRSVREQASFTNSDALNQGLTNMPEIRNEAVKRAQDQVLGDVPYPPAETVAKIAHLLAINLDRNQ
jgi:hypothetical protein